MIGQKVTLTAATATKIATGGVGNVSCLVKTALTDLCFGGSSALTSANGYATGAALTNLSVPIGKDDLWAISAAGGDIYVLYPENA